METLDIKLLRFLLEESDLIGLNGLRLDTPNYAGHTAYQIACIVDKRLAEQLVMKGADSRVGDIEEDDHPDHNAQDMEDEVKT